MDTKNSPNERITKLKWQGQRTYKEVFSKASTLQVIMSNVFNSMEMLFILVLLQKKDVSLPQDDKFVFKLVTDQAVLSSQRHF